MQASLVALRVDAVTAGKCNYIVKFPIKLNRESKKVSTNYLVYSRVNCYEGCSCVVISILPVVYRVVSQIIPHSYQPLVHYFESVQNIHKPVLKHPDRRNYPATIVMQIATHAAASWF